MNNSPVVLFHPQSTRNAHSNQEPLIGNDKEQTPNKEAIFSADVQRLSLDLEAQKNDNQIRKLKKRLQLKNLIITKFRNKYNASASVDDDVNHIIQREVDHLFDKD